MIFLKKYSQVRVPDVYAILEGLEYGRVVYHIVMEFIEGGYTLDYNIWKAIGDDAHDKICKRIAEQFNLLRSIPSEGYYGHVHNQGWDPRLMLLRMRYKELFGPYKTYEEFVSALKTGAELQHAISGWGANFPPGVALWLDKLVPTLEAANGREPVFTHTDPSLRNMIIRPLEGTMATAKDYEVTLIDWEFCGWYPAWMQMVAFDKQLEMLDIDTLSKGNYNFIDKEPQKQVKAKIVQGLGNSHEEEIKLFRQTSHELF